MASSSPTPALRSSDTVRGASPRSDVYQASSARAGPRPGSTRTASSRSNSAAGPCPTPHLGAPSGDNDIKRLLTALLELVGGMKPIPEAIDTGDHRWLPRHADL